MQPAMHQHNRQEEADRNDKLKKARQPIGHYRKQNFTGYLTRGGILQIAAESPTHRNNQHNAGNSKHRDKYFTGKIT